MGVREAAASGPTPWVSRVKCVTGRWLGTLDPEIKDLAEKAMARPDLSGAFLLREFAEDGLVASPSALNRHRRGECACGRP